MSDDKTPLDQALDLFVYAPVGLVLSLRELLPALAERGRKELLGQVTAARMVGEYAVRTGQKEAEKAVRQARQQAEAILGHARPPTSSAPASSSATAPASAPVGATVPGAPAEPPSPAPAVAAPARPRLDASTLAIPGYDTLSASQVVQRLAGLSGEELEAVSAYESAGRGRKTILHKVEQLRAAAAGA